MTDFTWKAPIAIASALTTELNSLTNGSFSAASSAYDNETNKHLYLDLEQVLASLTPTGSPYMSIFLLYSLDGTNFQDAPNTSDSPIAVLPFSTATAAKRKVIANILVAPLQFKLVAQNNMGVTLAASGNTLKYRLHDELGT